MSQTHKWIFKPTPDTRIVEKLEQEINVSTPIANILAQRGISSYEEAKVFFNPTLEDILDPFLMKDMQKAVVLINQTLANNQNIMVYGDYDVDGTTAVSLVYSYLKNYTNNITFYVPDRYAEGYGISEKGILYAIDNSISLIIALDCGIKSIEPIALAKENNVNFIVCDHHLPGEILPVADAILNPKQKDCMYPFKELTGCGIGFKLIQALNATENNPIEVVLPFLDLVVVSIAADMVPINGENRALAFYGLEILNKSPRMGLHILLEGMNGPADISKIVFGIAPKINAAGRIKHASHSINLLICEEQEKAKEILLNIESFNTTRRGFDTQVAEEALAQIKQKNEENNYSTVVYDKNWHLGILGIVASRLIGTYYRPTLVFTKNGEFLVASARSTATFDLYEALLNFEHLFVKFGGHKFAAGLSILEENLPIFKQQFEAFVKNNTTAEERTPAIEIDCEFDLMQISNSFLTVLNRLAPFGPGNMRPVFLTSGVTLQDCQWIGKDKNHLRCKIKPKNTQNSYNAVYFNCLDKINTQESNIYDIVFTIQENYWNNQKTIQLNIVDSMAVR